MRKAAACGIKRVAQPSPVVPWRAIGCLDRARRRAEPLQLASVRFSRGVDLCARRRHRGRDVASCQPRGTCLEIMQRVTVRTGQGGGNGTSCDVGGMVLPDRIELSTSPLPMECSTTELRQHARGSRIGRKGPDRRPVLTTRTPLAQARGRGLEGAKTAKNQPEAPLHVLIGSIPARSGSLFAGPRPSAP